MMFHNATVSSRSSSSKSGGNSCSRNSSMPSLRMRSPISQKTSYNPLFRHSDITSFDASHFIFNEKRRDKRERKCAVLRRYNSHDSTTNYAESRHSSNDNTPDSTKSRDSRCRATPERSPDSTGERIHHQELDARDFLERYSLPRVVRVDGGDTLLLYRCFDSFTKIEAKGIYSKRTKDKSDGNTLHFPEGYNGWFSLITDKGERCAVTHTSVLQLVREQVCSFINIQPFIAYAGHHPDSLETIPGGKFQYLKTQVKPGQQFQLRAVFQHCEQDNGRQSTKSSRILKSTRDKDLANRYAQLISQNNQEFYVPLTTKGEFYEIHSSIKEKLCFPGMLDKTGPLALDKDCLYKLTHLLRRVALPIKVKLMFGPLPYGLPKDFPDTYILERKFQEPLLVTCTLPAPSENIANEISCINLNSNVKISRCMLGFDSENRLFKSQRLQTALAFCHTNVESWYREVRLVPNINNSRSPCLECTKYGKSCKNGCKCLSNKNSLTPEESLSSEEIPYAEKQLITKEVIEKFPKPKKWYKHFKLLSIGSENSEELDKIRNIDRYKDMSKLIEEKFGKKSYNPVKKSASFMFSTKRIDLAETQTQNKPALLKCQSLDTNLFSSEGQATTITNYLEFNHSKSNVSDNLSYDFQMCILENDNSLIETRNPHIEKTEPKIPIKIDLDEIKVVEDKPRKDKPDLIPTLKKENNSYITDRLCSEFHVKTKIQKRIISKHSMLASNFEMSRSNMKSLECESDLKSNIKSVIGQIHETKPKSSVHSKLIEEDIPYCQVADKVCFKPNEKRRTSNENIYAEICDANTCHCVTNSLCKCENRRKSHSEYCYVKLGSNGESVISDSDEAIYNTLS